ncbi:PhoX family phosphatase [Myxosarcina sp. GI1]|uniref:PhoX family protein n=1 Tax=Myxosarcina sp. GI1 TaxID=1541065 RepID=UPI0005627076|nr:alkaline phosphatase PhoX [Myxosarcina sp. GI1]
MTLKRRNLLLFLGAAVGSLPLKAIAKPQVRKFSREQARTKALNLSDRLGFQPVKPPLPLKLETLATEEQIAAYSSYEVKDDLVLPDGFTYDVIAAWGDRVGDSRFGYNNDYLALVETTPNEGLLTVNFEYLSSKTWMQTYPLVIGKTLPFAEVAAKATDSQIDAFTLSDDDPLKAQIVEIAREGLTDLGIGVISVRRNENGQWERTYRSGDRRITGISGLDDESRLLKSTGAATAIFNKENKLGYKDNLGDRIIGTFQNCAGGMTPWGTVLSAEENFQDQVIEAVMADGSAMSPSQMPFVIDEETVAGNGNVFGLAGNKYGWMVEVDPANPNDYGTKHTWLGRFRHEAFGIRAVAGKKLAVYSGCDRRGGHLYKFISRNFVNDPQDKANSSLFEAGMLYGAKLNPDGSGEWIPLSPETAVNPILPSQVVGGVVQLPNNNRNSGGAMTASSNSQVPPFQERFAKLGDLYRGSSELEQQGAILIDAHLAASAAGVTCTARPEDTEITKDGTLFITFTSGAADEDGGPDKQVFTGPNGESDYEYGWIMKLEEDNSNPESLSFRWSMLAMGGEPALGGAGFANPDNLAVDNQGNLWMVTDMSTDKQNSAVSSRMENDKALSSSELTGVFGNNSLWYVPLSGDLAGEVYPFAMGPMECECTGLMFSNDSKSLFLSIQHPGEANGIRRDMASELKDFELLTSDGKSFIQKRQVPVGSNWFSGKANQPPIPAVVAIRRLDNEAIAT